MGATTHFPAPRSLPWRPVLGDLLLVGFPPLRELGLTPETVLLDVLLQLPALHVSLGQLHGVAEPLLRDDGKRSGTAPIGTAPQTQVLLMARLAVRVVQLLNSDRVRAGVADGQVAGMCGDAPVKLQLVLYIKRKTRACEKSTRRTTGGRPRPSLSTPTTQSLARRGIPHGPALVQPRPHRTPAAPGHGPTVQRTSSTRGAPLKGNLQSFTWQLTFPATESVRSQMVRFRQRQRSPTGALRTRLRTPHRTGAAVG